MDNGSLKDLSISVLTSDSSSKSMLNHVRERVVGLSPTVKNGLERECTKEDFNLEMDNCIGKGSFGEVFKVNMNSTGKTYAIKVLDKLKLIDNQQIERLNREIEIMYKVNHPHIIKLINHFEDDKKIYLVMPFMQKGQLYKHLKAQMRFDERTACQYILETIEAVSYLHSFHPRIVHRDIKPENILLDQNFRIQLSDMGIADYLDENTGSCNLICGSPEYMAPEIHKGLNYDYRVDIWAIGVLIFELIAGYPPFSGSDYSEIALNIKKVRINWSNDFPPLAKNLVSKILKLDPLERLSLDDIKKHAWFSKTKPLRLPLEVIPMNDKDMLSFHMIHNNQTCERVSEVNEYFNSEINKLFTNKERNEKEIERIILLPENTNQISTNQIKNQELQLQINELTNQILILDKEKEENAFLHNNNCYMIEKINNLQQKLIEKEAMIDEVDEKVLLLNKEIIELKNNQISSLVSFNSLNEINKTLMKEIENLNRQLSEVIITNSNLLKEKEQHKCITLNIQQDKDQTSTNYPSIIDCLRELKNEIKEQLNSFNDNLHLLKLNQRKDIQTINEGITHSTSLFISGLNTMNDAFYALINRLTDNSSTFQLKAKDDQIEWLKTRIEELTNKTNQSLIYKNKCSSLEMELNMLKEKYETLESNYNAKTQLYSLIKEKESKLNKKVMEKIYVLQNIKGYAESHFSKQHHFNFFKLLK